MLVAGNPVVAKLSLTKLFKFILQVILDLKLAQV